jgi:hypothetical protein
MSRTLRASQQRRPSPPARVAARTARSLKCDRPARSPRMEQVHQWRVCCPH